MQYSGRNFSLVVMAAGLGTRFGGLKQLTPVGPFGETLADYAIFDAIQAGCSRVVIIVREEIRRDMAQHFDHWKAQTQVRYVNQKLEDIPFSLEGTEHREKPWGTVHAIWSAREVVEDVTLVLNADDYYGASSYRQAAQHIRNSQDWVPALIGYRLRHTVSPHGGVTRGICQVDERGNLGHIVEQDGITLQADGRIMCSKEGEQVELSPDSVVSMNFWVFSRKDVSDLQGELYRFLEQRGRQPKSEFHIPMAVGEWVADGKRVQVIPTESDWFGMTYKEDMEITRQRLKARAEESGQLRALWEV